MTEDEPLTLPPMEWVYCEDPEPSWHSDEYVISVKGDVYHSFRPYLIRYGRETWRESTLVKAKETADRHRLRRERSRRGKAAFAVLERAIP